MSWNLSESGVVVDDTVIDRLEEIATEHTKSANPDGLDQAQLAVRVVNDILRSGVLGDETKTYSVSISGHGNPEHKPTSGWANDYIQIRIAQE